MNLYRLAWYIDIEADDPHDAARQALDIHRDPESIATIFTVIKPDGTAVCIDAADGAEYPSDHGIYIKTQE